VKVIDTDGAEIVPDEKAESQLVLVRIIESDDNHYTYRDSHDYVFVSFNSEYATNPQVKSHIPEQTKSHPFCYNEITKYDSHEASQYFFDFETFDTWIEDHTVNVATD
jgi:hypothetical protein